MGAFWLFINLFLSALLLLWFGQNSLENYWQHTYHRSSPFQSKYHLWQAGGRLQKQAYNFYYSVIREINPAAHFLSATNAIASETNEFINKQTEIVVEPISQTSPVEEPVADSDIHDTLATNISAPPEKIDVPAGLSSNDKVLFAGDSLMQGVAPTVIQHLKKEHNITSINLSKPSTGLSYKAFYDWEVVIEETLTNSPEIKLLVMMIGANDPWDFADPNNKNGKFLKLFSPEWEKVYSGRIENIINSAKKNGAQVIWVGLPIMRSDKYNKKIAYLNTIFEKTLHANDGIYVPIASLMSDDKNVYTDSIKINGKMTKVRHKDGIHFLGNGYSHVGHEIIKHIKFAE